MAKKNDIGLVIVVALVVIGAFYLGGSKSGTIIQPQTNVASTAPCGSSGLSSLALSARYNNYAVVPASPTAASTSINVYQPGNPVAILTGTTPNALSVACGAQENVILGDNSAYFVTNETVTASSAQQTTSINLQQIATPAVSYNNNTKAGYSANAVIAPVANGYPDTDLSIRIKEGNGFFGNPDAVLVFAYSPTQIQGISGIQGTKADVPTGVVSIPSGDAVQAFAIAGLQPNQVVILNPTITTGTLPANSVNSIVNVYLISQATYNNNGVAQPGLISSPSSLSTPLVTPVTAGNIVIHN
jgi:hypothetical protein